MAVSRATSFAAVTNPTSAPSRVTAIHIQINPAATSKQFLAVYNAAAPTVGTDDPELIASIPVTTEMPLGLGKMKIVLPNGGRRFPTALSYIVTTTLNGATASTTHAPLAVEVFYALGN